MKTIMIERNFHIMNEDRFVMEKISYPVTVDEEASIEEINRAMNKGREIITANFKAAYPHLRTYLNFDEVVQVDKQFKKDLLEIERQTGHRFSNNGGEAPPPVFPTSNAVRNEPFNEPEHWQKASEKINKGTIEEQIIPINVEQIKKEIELYCKSAALFKAVYASQVKGNKELEILYELKLHKLENKKQPA